MKNYYELSLKCKYNRVMKIAEEIGHADPYVWEDCAKAKMTSKDPKPNAEKLRLLRSSILMYAAEVKNETWEKALGE